MNLEKILKALKERKRITPSVAWKSMEEATNENIELCYLWKIPSETYRKWYEQMKLAWKDCPTTLEQETTYIVYSGEKAFNNSKGGYSIFAISLGSKLRKEPTYLSLDRIETYPLEYAIDITDLMKGGEIK